MRVPQVKAKQGSQKWIQVVVNTCPEILNACIVENLPSLSGRNISWLSPLENDVFAEYRDVDFLKRIGLPKLTEKLSQFWPKNGPQWDALGKTSDGKAVLLVEAKANVPELISTCGAKSQKSLDMISESLAKTQHWLKCRNPLVDWKCGFYQYANRLAHLYFLKEKAQIEAYLIFLYFLGDDNHIPTSREAWNAALEIQKKLMGIPGESLTDNVTELFINIGDINAEN